MATNTPKKRGNQPRELRDIIRDLRGMLGRSSPRQREILLETIEALQELAHRLHTATQPKPRPEYTPLDRERAVLAVTPKDVFERAGLLTEAEVRHLDDGSPVFRRPDSHLGAVETEAHGEEDHATP